MNLNENNLVSISPGIPKPLYNRNALKPSIVHLGVGGFHRAHQAFYLDELLNKGLTSWTICGMGIKKADERIYKVMKAQDCLYTLAVKHPDGGIMPRVIGAIVDFIFVPENPGAAIEKLAHPETKIVSLTITEGGYNFDQNGEFIMDNPDIQWDIRYPEAPKTVFGLIAAALKARMEKNIPAFTVLSCDNIQHNGDVIKKMLLSFTGAINKTLQEWTLANVCFPNCMVDRITPVTMQHDIELLNEKYGIEDAWPVTCEPFIQWVMEDNFSNGRPAWEKVGVQFVSDIVPYETMKLRLLNAGHSLLGILGLLYEYTTIDQAVSDPDLQKLLQAFMDFEVTPTLEGVENIDLNEYKKLLVGRFANPYIKDQLTRICSESSAKLPKFLLPTIRHQLKNGGEIKRSAFVLAAWCYLVEVCDRNESGYMLQDEMLKELEIAAKDSLTKDPLSFISIERVFGDLIHSSLFVEVYLRSIKCIRKQGIKTAVQNLLSN